MPRPTKCRRVAFMPIATHFKPAGIPLRALGEVQLSVEEVEAIRLKDLEELGQEAGAARMNVSRATFQRILAAGRQKVADAILNGKAIKIGGGSFKIAPSLFRYGNRHEWEVPVEAMAAGRPDLCTTCRSAVVTPVSPPADGRGRHGVAGSRRGRGL